MASEIKKFKDNEKDLRIVPHYIEAEQALLAALLTSNSVYERISDFLKPEHFYDDTNGKIFEAISKLLENNQLADPLTLKNYFLQKDEIALIGGERYLIELAKNSPVLSNIKEYGKCIYDAYQRREILKIADEVNNEASSFDEEINASDIIEKAESSDFISPVVMVKKPNGTWRITGDYRELNKCTKTKHCHNNNLFHIFSPNKYILMRLFRSMHLNKKIILLKFFSKDYLSLYLENVQLMLWNLLFYLWVGLW